MPQIMETNDNGPDAPLLQFDPATTSFYVFEESSGGFRLLKFSNTVEALCQAPAPLMNQPEVRYKRGLRGEIAAAKRTFGDESGLPFENHVRPKPAFLRVV